MVDDEIDDVMAITYTTVIPLDSHIRDGYTWIDTGKIDTDHESYDELNIAVRGIS